MTTCRSVAYTGVMSQPLLLAINAGSSSLKYAAFAAGPPVEPLVRGGVPMDAGEAAAIGQVLDDIGARIDLSLVKAVGHRFVHGGESFVAPQIVTPDLVAALRRLIALDPTHLPAEIAVLEVCQTRLPGIPQVACFDTAFHASLPPVARTLPVPRKYAAAGIRRYGFHGLSFAYLMEELGRRGGPAAAHGRVVLAHIGAGVSLAAVRDGRCQDTTMGFTPTGGVMMATRSGDLDPGVLIHLMRTLGLDSDALDRLVNREAGLLGVSGTTGDVRDLLARSLGDPHAAAAIELFCYQIRKAIGALAAVLGGLDTLVFSGGVGEHSDEVRRAVCDTLGFLNVRLDPARNAGHADVLSPDGAAVAVWLIPTNEELMIAREVARLVP